MLINKCKLKGTINNMCKASYARIKVQNFAGDKKYVVSIIRKMKEILHLVFNIVLYKQKCKYQIVFNISVKITMK